MTVWPQLLVAVPHCRVPHVVVRGLRRADALAVDTALAGSGAGATGEGPVTAVRGRPALQTQRRAGGRRAGGGDALAADAGLTLAAADPVAAVQAAAVGVEAAGIVLELAVLRGRAGLGLAEAERSGEGAEDASGQPSEDAAPAGAGG